MSTRPPDEDKPFATSLPDELRKCAAETVDPQLRSSLLQRADSLELKESRLNALASSGEEARNDFHAFMEARRRRHELPVWAVALVLLGFALFLVFIALKHPG